MNPPPPGDDPPDLRLVPPALAAWAAALVALGLPGRLALGCAGAGAVGAGLLLLRHPGRGRLIGAAVLVAASAAAASAALRVEAVAAGPVASLAAERARVSADLVVTSDPDRSPARVGGDRLLGERFTLRARLETVRARGSATDLRTPVLVLASDESWGRVVPGQRVRATGRLTPPRHEGELVAVLQAAGRPETLEVPPAVQRIAERLRSGLRASVSGLPPETGGLLPGLVVGDTTGLLPEVEDDFRAAGLSHLVAVSGANVAIILGGVLLAARYAGVRGAWLPVSGALAVAGFVVLARPQPSVLRAAVMGLIAVLALATGRRRRGLPALSATVLLLVLADPWLARSFGFSLSVLATAGLLVLAPGWRRALARRLPTPVADAIAVPAAAQAACAPVLVLLDPRVSLVAVPANLLVAPAVAPATLLGALAAVLAPIAPVAGVLGTLAGVPAWWIVTVARHAADVPAATVPWPGGWTGAAALVIALLAARVLLPRLLDGRRAVVAGVVVAAFVAVAALPRPGWPPAGWLLVACDVGQGDALVLAAEPGTAVVVDAGPDPRAVDRCLKDLDVRRIPLVILTHLHADHVEGLPGVLRGRSVGEIQVGPLDEPAAEADRVAQWAASASVPVTRAAVGESRRIGDLTWEVVWPSRVIEGEGSVPNNASVVLLVQTADTRMLLAGDVEPAAQRALLPALEGRPVDVLKVPHHGSAYQAPELLADADPRVSLVSVGEDNGYGHPAPSTLTALSASGATVLRTDQDGDIAVAVRDGRLAVATQR